MTEVDFVKLLEDSWHACRTTAEHQEDPIAIARQILRAQMAIIEALYYLRTGRGLQ